MGWIDTARGMAILLVVSLHSASWLRETPIRVELWWDICQVFITMRMPLLYVCSGMLAAKWLRADWGELLPRKVTFLFWVYLIWQPIGSVMALISTRVTGDDELTLIRMLASLTLSPVRPRFELWFIWTLAVFFVLARLCARVPQAPQFAVAAMVSAIWFSSLVTETNLGWDGGLKHYVFFLIGIHYRVVLQGFAERLGFWPSLLLIGSWLALSVADYVLDVDKVIGVGLAIRLLGVAAGIALALHLQQVKLFGSLGSRTLPIYLAHPPLLITFTWLVIVVLGVTSPLVISVLPALFTVAAIVLSLQLHSVLLRNSVGRYLYSPPPAAVAGVKRIVSTAVSAPISAEPVPQPSPR